jgi:hypothetical protein
MDIQEHLAASDVQEQQIEFLFSNQVNRSVSGSLILCRILYINLPGKVGESRLTEISSAIHAEF